jgi:hypothetical protein
LPNVMDSLLMAEIAGITARASNGFPPIRRLGVDEPGSSTINRMLIRCW